jgi:hypothetical protein
MILPNFGAVEVKSGSGTNLSGDKYSDRRCGRVLLSAEKTMCFFVFCNKIAKAAELAPGLVNQ